MAEHPCDLSYLLKAGGLQAEGRPGQLGQETLSQNRRTGLDITVVSPCLPPTRSWVQSQHCPPKKGEMQGKTPRGWRGKTSLCMTWIQPYRGKQDEWDHLGSLGTKHQVSPACSPLMLRWCGPCGNVSCNLKQQKPRGSGELRTCQRSQGSCLVQEVCGDREVPGRVAHEAERDLRPHNR